MADDPQLLRALIGMAVYAISLLLALVAAVTQMRAQRPDRARLWLSVAMLLALLIVWRWIDGDEIFRMFMRSTMKEEGTYGERRRIQAPILLAVMLVAGAAAWIFWRNLKRQMPGGWQRMLLNPHALAAQVALVFAAYSLVRAISFHPFDAIIYRSFGPLNINRLVDLGLAALLGVLALWAISAPTAPSRPMDQRK